MVDIASLVTLCETTLAGGSKLLELYRKKKFSKTEKELLIAAAKRGEFYLLSENQIPGTWIRADGKDFLDEGDPAFAATYLEAFRGLCERGYIVHEGGRLFNLTGSGFQKARELASKS